MEVFIIGNRFPRFSFLGGWKKCARDRSMIDKKKKKSRIIFLPRRVIVVAESTDNSLPINKNALGKRERERKGKKAGCYHFAGLKFQRATRSVRA